MVRRPLCGSRPVWWAATWRILLVLLAARVLADGGCRIVSGDTRIGSAPTLVKETAK